MLVDLGHKPRPLDFPWLMLPDNHHHHHHHEEDDQVHNKYIKCFFSLYTHQTHCLELPEAFQKCVCGSSSGWLIFSDETTSIVTLLNPLNRAQIALPPLSASQFYHEDPTHVLHKAILSADPSRYPFDYNVVAIFGEERRLIFYKSSAKMWILLEEAGSYYEDLISFNEELLATNELGGLLSIDLGEHDRGLPPNVKEISYPFFFKNGKVYLVGIGGELVMLIRFVEDSHVFGHETYDFEAYRYDSLDSSWDRIKDLGGWTLFLGHNHSAAIEAQHFKGVKPNCIYFTDNNPEMEDSLMAGHDSGVYSMKDGTVEHLQCLSSEFMSVWPRPVWFMPSLSSEFMSVWPRPVWFMPSLA